MQNNILNELGTNFIEYAVAVNTDRAIPDAKSGLKPVAKRILWSAYEEGRTFSKPHVKAARIVGDVMGKYHPHGDSSIYGAMVRLSQDWVMRYPLIDWHGNNGNIAGDGPAAARYTEARLSKIAEDGLLEGLKKKNVDFIPNYSEDADEPVTLPSIFPNLLCNPNSGIGVAMACNWLPHNLKEVAECIEKYIDGVEYSLPGPDFPTGGIIINKNDIPAIMATGHGSVKVRGRYKIEKQKIVFYEIPYGTTIEGLLNEIAEVCNNKEVEGVEEVRDESNKKGLRIVIECEKGVNPDTIAQKLFLKTDLQSSISYNQVGLVNKTPTELNLEDCLKIYVNHNIDCICREADFDLKKAGDRVHILNGLLMALEDIDNIITLIKKSENSTKAKDKLIEKYNFTEIQAKAILAMRLSSLASLEKIELQNEKAELDKAMDELNALLANENLQKDEIKNRLNALVKKYGDARKTELTQIDIKPEEKEIESVIPEDVVVVISQNGDAKRIPAKNFKMQKRNGKGIKNEDDAILEVISTNTIDNLMIFTNVGKMYKLLVDKLPIGTNASKGANLATMISMDMNEKIIAVSSLNRKTDAQYVVFITKQGLVKKTIIEEYTKVKKSTGIAAIKLNENDTIANVLFMKEEDLILFTKQGMSIRFETKDIKAIGRTTAGVKGIKLSDNDEVIIGLPVYNNHNIIVITTNGYGKQIETKEFPIQGRGGKGVRAALTELAGAVNVQKDNLILAVGKPNSICISTNEVPLLGRVAQGNMIIKGSTITKVVKI